MKIVDKGIAINIPWRVCKIRHYYTAYVAVPPTHPWHEVTYDNLPHGNVEFTYSQYEETIWVVGWDYAHYGQEGTTLEDVKRDVLHVVDLMNNPISIEVPRCLKE